MSTTPRTTEVEKDAMDRLTAWRNIPIDTHNCHLAITACGELYDEIERLRRPAPAADGRVEMREALRKALSVVKPFGLDDEETKIYREARSALASDTATREGK